MGVQWTSNRRPHRAVAPHSHGSRSGADTRLLLEAIASGVLIQDTRGRIVAHNAAACQLLGLPAERLTGRTSMDPRWRATAPDGSILLGEQHPAMVTLRTGQPVEDFTMGVRRADGTLVWLSVSSKLCSRAWVREVVVTFVDITAERCAERALRTTRAAEQVLLRAEDETHLLQEICDVIVRLGGHALAWVGIGNDDDDHTVTVRAAAGDVGYVHDGLVTWSADDPRGRGPVGTAIRTGRVVLVEDVETDLIFRTWRDQARSFGFGSVVAIPFRVGDRPAAMTIYSADVAAFDRTAVDELAALGVSVEHGLASLSRRRRLDGALSATVHALADLAEIRDPYTSGHQRRVAELSAAIAAKLGLTPDEISLVRLGALAHDIGKVGVPAEVLTRPGRLNDIGLEFIRGHAEVGERLLREASLPSPVPEIAGQHHERFDGSGYPRGLRGDRICLGARIVAVADVVEAITHHRPYRPALGLDVAVGEISDGAGSRFDGEVVAAALDVLSNDFPWTADQEVIG